MRTSTRARRYADVYSSAEVARLAGITYRQVDYWVRIGLLRTAEPVEGSGTARRFAAVEVNVARVVAALHSAGVGEGSAAGNVGGELVRATAQAVRQGATSVQVGAWYVALDDLRVTLWTAYRHGGNGDRHP